MDNAQPLAEEWKPTIRPRATVATKITFPVAQATMELHRGKHEHAIQIPMPLLPYERAAGHHAMFVRGQAYLGLDDGAAAAAEFRKMIDNRGLGSLSVLYPLA